MSPSNNKAIMDLQREIGNHSDVKFVRSLRRHGLSSRYLKSRSRLELKWLKCSHTERIAINDFIC
jgi:hypothetical protein